MYWIYSEHDLQKDFGNTLDQAVGVLRKCHEELSKTIKGPKLGVCELNEGSIPIAR